MSIKVRKRNGKLQKYKVSKLVRSLQEAGFETGKAKLVASLLAVRNKMTTYALRKEVHRLGKKIDKVSAEKYMETHGVHVKEELLGVDGYGLLTEDTMRQFGLNTGDMIDVLNGERYETIRTYQIDGNGTGKRPGNVYISSHNIHDIGAHRGSKIAMRRHFG